MPFANDAHGGSSFRFRSTLDTPFPVPCPDNPLHPVQHFPAQAVDGIPQFHHRGFVQSRHRAEVQALGLSGIQPAPHQEIPGHAAIDQLFRIFSIYYITIVQGKTFFFKVLGHIFCHALKKVGQAEGIGLNAAARSQELCRVPGLLRTDPPDVGRRVVLVPPGGVRIAHVEDMLQGLSVQQLDALLSLVDPSVEALVPQVHFGAGCGLRALLVDEELVLKGILVVPSCAGQKRRPGFLACSNLLFDFVEFPYCLPKRRLRHVQRSCSRSGLRRPRSRAGAVRPSTRRKYARYGSALPSWIVPLGPKTKFSAVSRAYRSQFR